MIEGGLMTSKNLRTRAEDAMRVTRGELTTFPEQDVQRIVHELQVHQIELEMQNEALRVAQQDLERSHEEFQELFDCAPVGYVLLNAVGQVTRANTAVMKLLNVQSSSLIGQHFYIFVAPEDRLLVEEHVRKARQHVRATCEVRLRTRDSGTGHARLDLSTIPSSTTDCLVGLTDISERKRSQEALERLNHQLEAKVAARTSELAVRNRDLEQEIARRSLSESKRRELETHLREAKRFESLGLLAAGIAHDFNNLLVGVLGNAELLLLTPGLTDSFREPLSLIRRAGRHASDLTRQLLVFAGRGQLIMTPVNLPRVVADNLELLRTRLPAGVQLQSDIAAELPVIDADRGQINQVVMNLVMNAIEALEVPSAIVVQTRLEHIDAETLVTFQHNASARPGEFAVLLVQDAGRGIDTPTLARIFDPFFSTKFAGRGLGLASVLGIVQSHRGALRVRTKPGIGTCFEVAFPVGEPQQHESQHPGPLESEWKGAGSILLIDDDEAVARVVAQMLKYFGFDVTVANDGEAGLALFRRRDPAFQCVVLDWIMPGFSGERVLQELRALEPTLPVVVISGYCTEDLTGYDQYMVCVQKPMTVAQLRDAVSGLLGEAATRLAQ
jgi:PAS domain S-box-containing protein